MDPKSTLGRHGRPFGCAVETIAEPSCELVDGHATTPGREQGRDGFVTVGLAMTADGPVLG